MKSGHWWGMYRTDSIPEVRPVSSVHVAVGTFLLLWIVWFIGLTWGRSGLMPGMLMGAFDFVYVDLLYQPAWTFLINVLPVSSVGYYPASTFGYALLSVFVAAWVHVLRLARER